MSFLYSYFSAIFLPDVAILTLATNFVQQLRVTLFYVKFGQRVVKDPSILEGQRASNFFKKSPSSKCFGF